MAQISETETVVHSSLGFQALCNTIRETGTCDLLELGPVRSGNIEFWARFSPSIFVADLRSSLPLPVSHSEEGEFIEPDWENILNLPDGRSFNVILAWDLFNYMEIPAVSSLVRHLCRYCSPGALLFALIFDRKQMPEIITVYRIVDESHLAYEYAGTGMRPCPRHQPRALSIAMSNFRTFESYRLRNGMVEYVYAYEGLRHSP
ncbi:MAG: hypothetical protein JXR49_17650 [Acidobacteria bacterium]|nr:hypothetical protein [Acidobacteriota bacterium]